MVCILGGTGWKVAVYGYFRGSQAHRTDKICCIPQLFLHDKVKKKTLRREELAMETPGLERRRGRETHYQNPLRRKQKSQTR